MLAAVNPFFWWDLIKLFAHNAVAEQYLKVMSNKYKRLKPYVPLGIKIANSQRPRKGMLELVEELKNIGYEIHLFSN